ncbi:GntR family transcriptional regulator [Amycolatopsis sp. A1MSW2902]
MEEIRERIFSGSWRPGARIDQGGLADYLGVSRLPVREALIVPHRGVFPASLTREDIRDQYLMLAGLAAERAATRLPKPELDALADLAEQLETEESPAAQERLNFEFHRVLNRGAESPRLLSELKLLAAGVPAGFYEAHHGWAETAHQDHREIVAAVRTRSRVKARRLVEGHFRRGGDQAVALLEERGFWRVPEPGRRIKAGR